jgi:HD superfamily phosphohydrolase
VNKKDWKEYTQFKDLLHGYIKIHKPLVKEIINTSLFQRLKGIEQTGMEVLYPSATHNRFIHSLGVYHLGEIAFNNFVAKIKSKYRDCYNIGPFQGDFGFHWHHWAILFKLACLLHDIGHSPFSHTLEFLYDLESTIAPKNFGLEQKQINKNLIAEFSELGKFNNNMSFAEDFKDEKLKKGSPHEKMSAYLILENYGNTVKNLIKSYMSDFYDDNSLPKDWEKELNPNDDLEFMARMILGCHYRWKNPAAYERPPKEESDEKWTQQLQMRNCIINLLNSKIDVDNLDYTSRDTQISGYKNTHVDIERLLNSLTIIKGHRYENKEIEFDENYSINNPVMLEKNGFSGDCFTVHLVGQRCIEIKGGNDVNDQMPMNEQVEILPRENIEKINKFTTPVDFNDLIELHDKKNISILPLDKKNDNDKNSLFMSGKLKGRFTGTVYGKLPVADDGRVPEKLRGYKISYVSAFDKNCQSAINGAVLARNYEQRWVYAHHTVTYHTRFIMQYLLQCYCNILYEQESADFLKRFNKKDRKFSFPKGEDKQNNNFNIDQVFYLLINKLPKPHVPDADPDIQEKLDALVVNLAETSVDPAKDPSGMAYLKEIKKILDELPAEKTLLKRILNVYLRYKKKPIADDKKKDLNELLEWIIAIYNISPDSKKGADEIIDAFLESIEELIDDKGASYGSLVESLSGQNQMKKRFMDTQMQYMVDVIAMPEKKKICGQIFKQSNDEDLYALYRTKMWEIEAKPQKKRTRYEEEFFCNADRYFSRNFPNCMWKTHAEFFHLFRLWGDEEIEKAFSFFKNPHTPLDSRLVKDGEESYMRDYFVLHDKQEEADIGRDKKIFFDGLKTSYNISRFIFVAQMIVTKNLDPYATYFNFNDAALRLCDIPLQDEREKESKRHEKFFYFYYEIEGETEKKLENHQIRMMLDDLRGILREWNPPAAQRAENESANEE